MRCLKAFLNPNEKFFNSNEEIQRGALDKMTEQFRQALCQVMELIERSHIVIPDEATVELYHHEGIEKFLNVGAAFIRIVNGEYCKSYVVQLPGQHYPDHYHKIKIETFYVIWGELIVNCEGVTSVLKPAGIRTIQRGESHSFFTETGAVFEELSTTYLNNDSVYSEKSIQRSTYNFRKTMISFRKLKEVSENE